MSENEIAALLNRPIEDENYGSTNDDFDDEASDDGDVDYEPEVEDDDVPEDDITSDLDDNDTTEIAENQTEYWSKDRDIKWTTIPPENRLSRAASERIIHQRKGVTSFAVQRISEIRDAFDLCLTQAMKKDVIRFSNMQGNRVIENFGNIDEIEFDAYLGLLLLIGVYRSYGESIKCLWDEVHGRPILRAVMSLERFLDISRVLAFDDRQSRRSEVRGDKLAPIRDFYEKWTENLQLLYVPNENITVDEQLIPFRGRCPFKVYMPSKPGKYGMKAWIAADSATAFCLKFQIYLGRSGDVPERNQGERVVLDLVSEYHGRNVTTDNFFTNHNLALELLKRKMTLVGTVRKNKRFLPVYATAKQLRKLPVFSSKFFFYEKETVVQYVPKKYKLVTLLSTLHHDNKVLEEHPKKIPEVIEFYNSTKGGVDTMDQMVRTYSCKRQTNRWPVALFSNFIDISALNAFILWTEIHPNWNYNKLYKRRLFLQQLGERLVRACIVRRNRLPRAEASAAIVRNIQNEESTSSSSPIPAKKLKASDRKRCKFCPPNHEKKTFTTCSVCNKPVCPTHRHTTTISTTYCEQHIP